MKQEDLRRRDIGHFFHLEITLIFFFIDFQIYWLGSIFHLHRNENKRVKILRVEVGVLV